MHNILGGYTQLSGPLYHYIPGRLSRYPLSIDSKVMKPKAELWTCLVTLGKWVGWLKALGLPHEDINQQLLVYYPSSCNSLFTSQKLNPQLGDLFFPLRDVGFPEDVSRASQPETAEVAADGTAATAASGHCSAHSWVKVDQVILDVPFAWKFVNGWYMLISHEYP